MPKNKKLHVIGVVIFLLTPFTINSALATPPGGGYSVNVTSCETGTPTLGTTPDDVTADPIIAGGSNTTALGEYVVNFSCNSVAKKVYISMTDLTNADSVDIPFAGITYQAAIPAWLGANGTANRPALSMSTNSTEGIELTPVLASTKATWIPSLTVQVPSNQAIGTYTSTITTAFI
jgi:hypothetical protein